MKNINYMGDNRKEPYQVRIKPYAKGGADDCFTTVVAAEEHRDGIKASVALLKTRRRIFDDGPDFKSPMTKSDYALLLSEPALKGKIHDAVLAVLSPTPINIAKAESSDLATIEEMIEWRIDAKTKLKRKEEELRTGKKIDWTKARTRWEKNNECGSLIKWQKTGLRAVAVDRLTPQMARDARDLLPTTDKAKNMMLKYLSAAFSAYTVEHSLMLTNPMQVIPKIPTLAAVQTEGYTWQQGDRIINRLWEKEATFRGSMAGRNEAVFDVIAPYIELIAHTGLRGIDTRDLKYGELYDLEGSDPTITRYMIKTFGTTAGKITKVFLTPRAVAVLQMLVARLTDMGINLDPDQNLFVKSDGQPLALESSESNTPFQRRYVPVLKELNLYRATMKNTHRFRAFAATELWQSGRSYEQIGIQLGIDAETAKGYVSELIAEDTRAGSKEALAKLNKKRGRKPITHELPRVRHLKSV